AQRFCLHVRDVLFASHLSAERGHGLMLEELKQTAVLDLAMRLGEGTGACILRGLIEAAVRIMGEMAIFESAGVKEKIPLAVLARPSMGGSRQHIGRRGSRRGA